MKRDQYPTTHTIARQLLAMADVTAIVPMAVFDSPGEMLALPVMVEATEIQGHKCVVFRPLPDDSANDAKVSHSGRKTMNNTTDPLPAVGSTALFGSWFPPESAPLNGTLILGDFGWPWPIPAVWDTYGEEWCVVTVQASPMQDGADNYWLESDTENKSQLKRWMPLPPLPNTEVTRGA